jgi:hypothetical protein
MFLPEFHRDRLYHEGAVVNMESTYYNLLAPASYGGFNKFKPKGYTKKQVKRMVTVSGHAHFAYTN